MTILRISLLALFVFAGSSAASALVFNTCSSGYKQCAAPCEGKKNSTAEAACLKHCKKKYC
jgi:hypothetical protein